MEREIVLDSQVKNKIDEVSKAWNSMLIEASLDEIRHRAEFPNYQNPIVTALCTDGKMIPLANALQKLFELRWI